MKVKGLKYELSLIPEDLVFQHMGTGYLTRILTRLYVQSKGWQAAPLPSSPRKPMERGQLSRFCMLNFLLSPIFPRY